MMNEMKNGMILGDLDDLEDEDEEEDEIYYDDEDEEE
jgi:hypothetical protein